MSSERQSFWETRSYFFRPIEKSFRKGIMEYLVVNWMWNVLATRDTFEECESWMRVNPTPDNSYVIVIRRKEEK